jgi:kynurenine formamidase
MKVHDLSMPILADHFRWPARRRETGDWSAARPFRVTRLDLSCHAFTHVDALRHMAPEGGTIDATPVEALTGPCFVADLGEVSPEEGLGSDRLDGALEGYGGEGRILLRSGWDLRRDWRQAAYWRDAPYVTRDGAERLARAGAVAIAFDFPQDWTIRLSLDGIVPPIEEHVTHDVLLRRGVTLIEYCVNAHALAERRVILSALPLKVEGADGAPARVVAYEGAWPGSGAEGATS